MRGVIPQNKRLDNTPSSLKTQNQPKQRKTTWPTLNHKTDKLQTQKQNPKIQQIKNRSWISVPHHQISNEKHSKAGLHFSREKKKKATKIFQQNLEDFEEGKVKTEKIPRSGKLMDGG